MKKNSRLTLWIFVGMAAGILLGYLLRRTHPDEQWLKHFSTNISVITEVFLRLIKMIIAPLVITTLVVGVAKLGDVKAVGRVGAKTMAWFISASLVSLCIGLVLVNLLRPGDMVHLQVPDAQAADVLDKGSMTFRGFITHMFPQSVAEAMADNEILQIVVFAIFFGVGTAALGKKGQIIIDFLDAVARVMLLVTGYVMKLAPLAVFAAMASVVAVDGIDVLAGYGVFILEFYGGLVMLWGLIALAGFMVIGARAWELLLRIKDPVLLAFSTSSSEAAFPSLMEELELFGCPNKIVSFVLPLGYSFNLDGSMMYMTFASLFIAQIYGIHLDLWQQITMLLVLMLSSKGIAGVPRAALVVIAGTLSLFGIPQAGLVLLLGIDHLLDMGRSATNIVGNGMATAVVARWEKALVRKTPA
jgi:Na+/H+-dicarboxylate symporter